MQSDLSAIVRQQVKALLRYVPRARRGHARAVHQGRVASRRLRETLPVAFSAAAWTDHAALTRDVRRITMALGSVREMDVALQEFENDAAVATWSAAVVDRVRQHLAAERDRRVRDMEGRLDRVDLKRLEERTRTLAADAEARHLAVKWRAFLGARVRKRAKRVASALRTAGIIYAPEPLHRVRLAAKKLRYSLELARTAAGAHVGREIVQLKRLQDLLGRLRERQILQGHVRTVASESGHDVVLTAALDAMHAELEAECRALHARFVHAIERLTALADRAAREIPAALAVRRSLRMARARPSADRQGDRLRSA